MTENNELRAVVLAALMVFSVFGGTIAFAGAASALDIDRSGNGSTDYDTTTSVGNVGNGSTIFQGEEDLTIINTGGSSVGGVSPGGEISPGQLERTAGENEGLPLQLPIPQDQATGTYEVGTTAFTVTVIEPRVTTFDVNNAQGEDVNGGVLVSDPGTEVVVEYNYAQADDIELTVEDENGVDVTNEIVNGDSAKDGIATASAPVTEEDQVTFDIRPNNVEEGEYTFSVEGVEDFDFGDATQSTTVEIVTARQASLNLNEDSAPQGQNVDFTIDNSAEGNFHAVVIESSDFREDVSASNAESIFRNVGDTVETGTIDNAGPSKNPPNIADVDAAFAIVEIDGGSGVGSIETQFLDDSSVTIDLLQAESDSGSGYSTNSNGDLQTGSFSDITNRDNLPSDDDQDLDVEEGTVELDNPSGTYIVGQEIDVNGTATEGTNDVALYARDRDQFELIQIDGDDFINVDGDNTFEEQDVDLSQDTSSGGPSFGNEILSLPGSYRIGIITRESAQQVTGSSTIPNTIDASDFNGGVSNSYSITVTDTALESEILTYNGQIATEDRANAIDVSGTAPGQSQIGVIFVGPRGNVDATTVSVDSDDTFSEEDLSISSLNQGTVSAHVLSPARDGEIGDEFTGATTSTVLDIGDFVDFVDSNSAGPGQTSAQQGFSGSANQVRDRVLANTVDDTASDDIMDTTTFRLADGLTTVESVTSPVEPNGTVEIEGQTNRKADDNTIVVELLDQDDTVVASNSTDQWGTNGTYSTSVELEGVEPGEYQLESDDGDNTDRVPIEVVEQVDEEETPTTATPEPDTPTPTPTATPEPDTPTPTEEPADDTETDTPSTDAGTPGFGIVVALTALIAAALLAVRRTN